VDSNRAGGAPAVAARKPPTIYDVARLAGVSHQTVSRHLKGDERMGPDIRERVMRALKLLDYKPNSAARALATNQSRRIGALTHEVHQVGPSRVLLAAIAAARSAGYLLDVVDLDPSDGAAIRDALALLTAQDCAGILALAATDEMVTAFEHIDLGLPVFLAAEPDDAVTRGTHPHAQGLSALVAHLAELGHTRFMHVAGPPTYSSARNRRLAYEAALRQHGLHSLGTIDGNWTAAAGYAAGQHLSVEDGVTAVIAANDQMALGVIRALSERGYRVPDDVSVTGMDDIPESAYFLPPLTTLRLDFAGEGEDAFRRMLTCIDGAERAPVHLPPAELVVRASTGPARR
jgi:DNA-binding LacI/PurR family transcriptional regulator